MEAKLFIFAAVAISEVLSACSPTGTVIKNYMEAPKRSLPFFLGVAATKCPGLNEFYYRWKIEEVYEGRKKIIQTSSTSTIYVDGYTYDSRVCFLADYHVSVYISHYPDMSFPDQITKKFYFSADPMEIEIVGGEQRRVLYGEDVIVDARKLSLDLSYPPDEDPFVGNFVAWRIHPQIYGYTPPNELVIRVPGDLLVLNNSYGFLVQIIRTKIPRNKHSTTAFQVVMITASPSPELNLLCMRNCINPNNFESTIFAVECTQNCQNLTYTWHISPEVDPDKIQFGNGTDKILFNGNSFSQGDTAIVTIFFGDIPYIKSIKFVSGILAGTCSIHPGEGISSVTKFQITCKGFYSPYGLSLCMIYQIIDKSESDLPEIILLSEFSFREQSDLYLPPGDPVQLNIIVEDHAFSQETVALKVPVKEFKHTKGEDSFIILSFVKILVLSPGTNSIVSYSHEGFHNEVVQLINSVTDMMEDINLSDAIKKDLHKHMVESVLRSIPVRMSSALQNLLILKKIIKVKLQTDTKTSRLIGKALLQSSLNTHVMFNHKRSTPLPRFFLLLLFQLTLEVSSDLMEANFELFEILNDDTPPHYYDSYDEFVSEKTQIRDDYRIMTTNIIVALQTSCLTNLYSAVPDEMYLYYETNIVTMKARRLLLRNLQGKNFTVHISSYPKNKVILPPELTAHLQKNYSYIDYQIAIFDRNPFWWHIKSPLHGTTIVLFDLFVQCEKIKNLEVPFLLYLEVIEYPFDLVSGTLTRENIVAYSVQLEPYETFVTEFFTEGEYHDNYLVAWSECFCTEQDFKSERSKNIRNGTSYESRTIRVENANKVKVIYFCIKKLTPTLSYSFVSQMMSCTYWDLQIESWLKGNCKIVNKFINTNGTMICQCTHVSVFAGEIFTPIVLLITDMKLEFTIDFTKNYLIIVVIVGLLLLWLISLALAHLRDKSLAKKNIVHKLDDNVPGDSNPYLVVVFTGFFYDAQTTADVAFQIIGNQSQSRTHLIKCHGVTLLKRNSQDWFIIYSPNYLGEIKKIKIWHNCKGSYPHWYCDRVIVQDMKIGEQYCFTVKRWFSVIWGGGKIYREIRVKKSSKKIGTVLFKTQLEKDIKDEHIWLSILTRYIQSNFTSKERVSTGFCFLFLSMLANALLYGIPEGIPADSIDEQNNFSIALSNIFILIESWILATPLSVLILFIFQNSAPL